MERINPTNGVRIDLLRWYARVYRPAQVFDPSTGGLVEGPPQLVCQMFVGIEPLIGRPLLEQLADGQVVNRVDMVVTCWYRRGLTPAMYLEVDDEGETHRLEILDIRDRQVGHRYQELYCQERR